jgi:hypothetical protein
MGAGIFSWNSEPNDCFAKVWKIVGRLQFNLSRTDSK